MERGQPLPGRGKTYRRGIRVVRGTDRNAWTLVTHDVEDNETVVGNPARVIRTHDAARFEEPADGQIGTSAEGISI
jgi:acetyltransferase-like isoleucine patch superfamily enzyme